MRLDGTLTKWNDDRGFGFIAPAMGGQEVFVHVSAFPRDGQRPQVGELLTFEIETDAKGKKRARAVERPVRAGRVRPVVRGPARPPRRMPTRAIGLLAIILLGAWGYGEYARRPITGFRGDGVEPASAARMLVEEPAGAGFRCDGRKHCSQMTSCAEATFFLRQCPGVKMDGDGDGVPCEEQWCTGPLAR